MNPLIVILLAIIAYILWRIYSQRENEIKKAASEKYRAKSEQEEKALAAKYPHLVGKLEGNWLEVFAAQADNGIPLLKLAFYLYLQESTKIDFSEGARKWDSLWDLTEELLEHLEKFHEGSKTEHEIAVTTYWQIAAESMGELIKESPKKTKTPKGHDRAPVEGKKLEVAPFTDLSKITSLFPKKANHPIKEISFFDKAGEFPRTSKGSDNVHQELKALGL
jgi:hypothetical protein